MKGILTLEVHKSLRRGFGPTKSQRNALSLFDLKDLKYYNILVDRKLVCKGKNE